MRLVVLLAGLLSIASAQEESEHEPHHHQHAMGHEQWVHEFPQPADHPAEMEHNHPEHGNTPSPHRTGRKQLDESAGVMEYKMPTHSEHEPVEMEHQHTSPSEHETGNKMEHGASAGIGQTQPTHAEHEHKSSAEHPVHMEYQSRNQVEHRTPEVERQQSTYSQPDLKYDRKTPGEMEHEQHINPSHHEFEYNSQSEPQHKPAGMEHEHPIHTPPQFQHELEHKPSENEHTEHQHELEHKLPMDTQRKPSENEHTEHQHELEHKIPMETQHKPSENEHEHLIHTVHQPQHEQEHKPQTDTQHKPETDHEHPIHEAYKPHQAPEHRSPHLMEHKHESEIEHKTQAHEDLVPTTKPPGEPSVLSFGQHHNEIQDGPLRLPNPFYNPKRLSDDVAREFCGELWHFVAGNPCMVRCDTSRWADFVRMGNQVRCRIPWDNRNFGVCHNGFCW